MRTLSTWLTLGLVAYGLPAAAQTVSLDYRSAFVTPLGAPDAFDLLSYDQASHRVFVTHGAHVTVVDARSGALIGNLVAGPGASHGVAVADGLGKGFTDDGDAGRIIVFDLKTLAVDKRIPGQDDADAITQDPATGHVFVANGDSKSVSVVDPVKARAIATIAIGGSLETIEADGAGKVYVNVSDRREVVRIDAKTNRIDARWPIEDCEKPHGLAMDRAWRRLFVSCTNALLVAVDMDSGAQVASAPIKPATDAAAFDPVRKRVFASSGLGFITVLAEGSPSSLTPAGQIKSPTLARTMTIDPETGRLFVVAPDIDPQAPLIKPSKGPARPPSVPGSLKLYALDPPTAATSAVTP